MVHDNITEKKTFPTKIVCMYSFNKLLLKNEIEAKHITQEYTEVGNPIIEVITESDIHHRLRKTHQMIRSVFL